MLQGAVPEVFVRAENGELIPIGYACEFDFAKGLITLPDNLPGGSEVIVNGEVIYTAPVDVALRNVHMDSRKLRRNVLAACIGAALYGVKRYG